VALDGDGTGRLRRVRLDDGQALDCDALFFHVDWHLRTELARTLGCELREDGSIAVDAGQATTVERIYAAGNCADPRALVPAAAGSGVTAAVAINSRLSFEDADRAAGLGVRSPASEAPFTGAIG
jgi:thioredoxin reductase